MIPKGGRERERFRTKAVSLRRLLISDFFVVGHDERRRSGFGSYYLGIAKVSKFAPTQIKTGDSVEVNGRGVFCHLLLLVSSDSDFWFFVHDIDLIMVPKGGRGGATLRLTQPFHPQWKNCLATRDDGLLEGADSVNLGQHLWVFALLLQTLDPFEHRSPSDSDFANCS